MDIVPIAALKDYPETIDGNCPHCGEPESDEETDIVCCTEPDRNYAAENEFGGDPADWWQLVKCPKCATLYVNQASNY